MITHILRLVFIQLSKDSSYTTACSNSYSQSIQFLSPEFLHLLMDLNLLGKMVHPIPYHSFPPGHPASFGFSSVLLLSSGALFDEPGSNDLLSESCFSFVDFFFASSLLVP